jgi:hypothetical protein
MGLTGSRDPSRFNTTGCIILPSALFIALMLATAGAAIWPKMAAPGAAIVCGGGEVVYESYGASYRPGEYTVSREIYCQSGAGKDATRDEITLQAMGVSFLIYSAAIFLLLQFVVRPLAARRLRRRMEALGIGAPRAQTGWPGTPAAPNLNDILARVQDAVQRGEAQVTVRNVSIDGQDLGTVGGGDIAPRLAQLKALRDQGLITAEDYEAKKAEILSGL